MDNKNIIFNHTLEQYNKKYRNRNYRLLKIAKKEVEDFDKRNPTKTKNYLLKDRKWWFINNTYYEIPKAPRLTWFRNLNSAVQAVTCLLGAGVVATSITLPLVLINNSKTNLDLELKYSESYEYPIYPYAYISNKANLLAGNVYKFTCNVISNKPVNTIRMYNDQWIGINFENYFDITSIELKKDNGIIKWNWSSGEHLYCKFDLCESCELTFSIKCINNVSDFRLAAHRQQDY